MARGSVQTKIFVVSMRSAAQRRYDFVGNGIPKSMNWDFFDAHENLHAGLHYDEDKAIIAKGRPLKAGELGCYSSHHALWQKLAEDDADQYLILEDDVLPDWSFIKPFIAEDHGEAGRDYVRLYYKKPAPSRILQKDFICRTTRLIELSGYCFGTQAYLLTKNGARRFLARTSVVNRPIDDQMDRSWVHGVRNLAVFPFPVLERAIPSEIGTDRFETYQIPERLKLRRFVSRHRERAGYQIFGRRRFRFQL